MSNRNASRTALSTAYLRAAHQILDAQPLVLEDPVALPLLGHDAHQRILNAPERFQNPMAQALRSHVVLRSRFAEDRLHAAIQRGVRQYIILGAGFDTFALRQPPWAQSLRIIEVDHPGTQTLKRSHMADAALALPANVALVHVDFEHESLLEGLHRQGIDTSQPTFFSWLGVTMYLNETAIDATLQSAASFPEGSEMVLTFLPPPQTALGHGIGHALGQQAQALADQVASMGEPFISHFTPEAMQAKLHQAGFSQVGALSPEQARAQYFDGRPADIPLPFRTEMAYAIR